MQSSPNEVVDSGAGGITRATIQTSMLPTMVDHTHPLLMV